MNNFWKALTSSIALALLGTTIVAGLSYALVLDTRQQAVALSQQIQKFEKAQNAPSILVYCEGTEAVVDINILHSTTNLWVEMVSPNGQSALILIYNRAYFGDSAHFVGSASNLVFSPGVFTLRGWIQPINEELILNSGDLFFETTFVVPRCGE
jgi:hypothetical protein